MTARSGTQAYVRRDDAPLLAPPPSMVGVRGWLMQNLFATMWDSVVTIVFGAFLLWLAWGIVEWGLVDAVWTGTNRDACLGEGACWPLVIAKMPQWIYGFYPIEERWRVNLCFLVGAAALIPMMMPSLPHKRWNALFLLIAYPLLTLILLSGGNLNFGLGTYATVICVMFLAAAAVPPAAFGVEDGISGNVPGLAAAGAALLLWLVSFSVDSPDFAIAGARLSLIPASIFLLLAAAAALSIGGSLRRGGAVAWPAVAGWGIAFSGLLAAMLLLDVDFGLVPVETSQWGGLTVTLVVSITGIVASLPLGIILALGRRSQMPVVKLSSIVFIELWRGVPLITVLFMSSVMLPLFLPEGVNFDKLLRALIGVALFSAAYMAEVVRSGLQAIPRGQYEGAMALGLSFWQMNNKIILPQALKVAIPNIVGNFISLFKDTTLVSIIGLFDLLGIVRAGLKDANWATPSSAPTGYFTVALMFWIFCFGMSRYSIFVERRLQTGYKR